MGFERVQPPTFEKPVKEQLTATIDNAPLKGDCDEILDMNGLETKKGAENGVHTDDQEIGSTINGTKDVGVQVTPDTVVKMTSTTDTVDVYQVLKILGAIAAATVFGCFLMVVWWIIKPDFADIFVDVLIAFLDLVFPK